ncbi:GNAT family N-acetyltransferase [Rossellomorea aquimaris]|uniref:GNAT family N-acetyltransferase n=1 Tax=Rossellomorea aquimaris TaxID=189382 RepID=UPI001CD7EAE3|nr:GNAT family protein [Rossellomorea aquimaris]MCA1053795.1 GNAT family N-acetyltransferase [Rossellomorea aquimaris]
MKTITKIYIRHYESSDAPSMLQFEVENKDFFKDYSPLMSEEFYTLESQEERVARTKTRMASDEYYAFGIFDTETDELIGNISLSDVIRGPLQCCYIGYSLAKQHNGKGYATEAVKLAVEYAFNDLKLHRVEAGVMLHNIASMRVLEKAGFHKEGIFIKNVKINGSWEDHQHFAIINPND